jgi:glyoxylase-like metal-dependent hydrolase (beta-lactamase superfamily II)
VRHTPGVFTAPLATPTVPPATTTNCHVVGTERAWIVDPATYEASEREKLCEILDERRAAGDRLEGILVTHHHPDHVGSVSALSQRYDLVVRGHALTLDRLPPGFRRGAPLADGDELELGRAPDGTDGWTLRALFTPGHDRGHLAFVESRYRALIAGDLVSTLSTIVIDPPEGHMATYLASLERCRAEGIGAIHPAHGMSRLDGVAVLTRYLEHRRAREEKLVGALARGARTELELLPEVYEDVDEALLPLAARSLFAGLQKLEEERRARRDGERWVLAPSGA